MQEAMQAEIEESLVVQAKTVSADIDKMLFERLQNIVTWNQLEIMQDIRINDVDKRLSIFLSQLKTSYSGVYRTIYCTNDAGVIVASSDSDMLNREPQKTPDWLQAYLSGGRITLESPTLLLGNPAHILTMRSSIASAFGGHNIGEVVLQFEWSQIFALLDQSAKTGQMLVILDQEGNVIAASSALRENKSLSATLFRSWLPSGTDHKVIVKKGEPLWASDVIVGFDRSSGYEHFAGFGWSTLIIQPLDQAFVPVRKVAITLLAIVSATIGITVIISAWVARVIAHPIVALTQFTRRFARDSSPPDPPAANGEVGELTNAFVQLVRDIEVSKQQLVRASKLAVVGEMAAAIAHEVRTPLGILRSAAQVLQCESGISTEGREMTEIIETETERLNRLVLTMLDSARPRAPEFTAVDVHEIIQHCVALLQAQARKKSIFISASCTAADSWIEADSEQITQVMLNLILNAVQILSEEAHIEINTRLGADGIFIEIADDGPGIPLEARARIFEAFFFRREGGIGLGLAIVQQIVIAHGGSINASSSPLGGALFRIYLPKKIGNQA